VEAKRLAKRANKGNMDTKGQKQGRGEDRKNMRKDEMEIDLRDTRERFDKMMLRKKQ
jgi:hypothetical protein